MSFPIGHVTEYEHSIDICAKCEARIGTGDLCYGGDTPYEAIKVIEAWQLGFRLGNVLKYSTKTICSRISRRRRWYLDREIAAIEASMRTSHPDEQPVSIQTQEEKSWTNLVQRKETEDA
jgi:hypothetical protein